MRTPPCNPIPDAPEDWAQIAGKGCILPIYEMHRRGETQRYFLRDTCLPPYKKPLLPGAALPPKAHRLLSQLKIAGAFLATALPSLPQSLPKSAAGVVFSVELPVPTADRRKRFLRWWNDGLQTPCLAAAFELSASETSRFYFSLDMKQIHPQKRRFPESFDPYSLLPASCAARYYNEAVHGLFDLGAVIFPCHLEFEFGELQLATRGLPDGAVVLDI